MGEAKEAERRITDRAWWVVDVGNTHVKSAMILDDGRTAFFSRTSPDELHRQDALAAERAIPVAVASVNSAYLARVLNFLQRGEADVRHVLVGDGTIFKTGIATADVATPQTTGVDRVLGCLGALAVDSTRSVVVVDCGTATTINVMTPDRCFRGGMIAPGRRLLAKALHSGTAALPEIALGRSSVEIGKSTNDSMEAGIAAAFLGAIRECTRAVLSRHSNANFFLTGGDADFASSAFPQFRLDDELTLRGLHWYATQSAAAP